MDTFLDCVTDGHDPHSLPLLLPVCVCNLCMMPCLSMSALRIVRKTVRVSVVGGHFVIIIDSNVLHPYTQPIPIKAFRSPQISPCRTAVRPSGHWRTCAHQITPAAIPPATAAPMSRDPHPTQTRCAAASAPGYRSNPKQKATTRVGRYAAKTPSHRMILYNLSHSVKETLLFRMCSTSLMSILS